jgi:D-lactate dehydrogenase
MKIALFDTRSYDREAFEAANRQFGHALTFLEPRLTRATARLAAGHDAVCSFVNDRLDDAALATLRDAGVRLIALRSAGYNHVDLAAAARLGLPVVRVPEYSPYAVAEHAVGLVLGCVVLAFDLRPDVGLVSELVSATSTYRGSTANPTPFRLHIPLTPATHHLIDAEALSAMKPGAMLVNTGRGALIDSRALIAAPKSGRRGQRRVTPWRRSRVPLS